MKLIELVIYIALLSVIMSTAVATLRDVQLLNAQTTTEIQLEQEGGAIQQKISLVIANATVIHSPPANTTSSTLAAQTDSASITISLTNGNIIFTNGGSDAQVINSNPFEVASLTFQQFPLPNEGFSTGTLETDFDVQTKNFRGTVISRHFSLVSPLWKR